MSEPEILFEHRQNAGVITLNRPGALNAVTWSMVLQLQEQLIKWADDPAVRHVIIKAAPGRAFSAGGDIRDLYERGKAGNPHIQFFWDEYRLNACIKDYPKPYIALIDGIVMGGGVGVSFHGSHRIAGDKISFAMPEVGIGFFPDVGGSYFLPGLPGEAGMYLALTGSRIKRNECLWTGLATHACASNDLADIEQALCEAEDCGSVLNQLAANDYGGDLQNRAGDIDEAFSAASLGEILGNLEQMANGGERADWANVTIASINSKSPLSLHVAHRQLREGAGLSMRDCMKMEYRIVSRILRGREFYEGIRAAIIDKDNAPKWQPPTISAVDPAAIDAIFARLDGKEGTLDGELQFDKP